MERKEDKKSLELILERITTNKENDAFNHYERAQSIANIISSQNAPFVITICGTWGSGKSSFLRFLCDFLPNNNGKTIIVYFNAWNASIHSDPLVAFVYELTNQLKKSANIVLPSNDNNAELLKCIEILTDAAVETFTNLNIATKYFSAVYFRAKKAKQDMLNEYENVLNAETRARSSFQDVSCILEDNNVSIYVMIDEIDRCTPTNVVRILEAIRTIFCGNDDLKKHIEHLNTAASENNVNLEDNEISHASPFRYILTMDEEYVAKSFMKAYNMEDIDDSYRYMSKFINYKYYLPLKSWNKYIENILNMCTDNNKWLPRGSKDDFTDLIQNLPYIDSVREAKQMLAYLILWQQQHYTGTDEIPSIIESIDKNITDQKDYAIKILNAFLLLLAAIKVTFPSEIMRLGEVGCIPIIPLLDISNNFFLKMKIKEDAITHTYGISTNNNDDEVDTPPHIAELMRNIKKTHHARDIWEKLTIHLSKEQRQRFARFIVTGMETINKMITKYGIKKENEKIISTADEVNAKQEELRNIIVTIFMRMYYR